MFEVTTDCCCIYCGIRHKAIVDLDKPPPRVFTYYQVACEICSALSEKDRKRRIADMCAKMRHKGKVRHKRYG